MGLNVDNPTRGDIDLVAEVCRTFETEIIRPDNTTQYTAGDTIANATSSATMAGIQYVTKQTGGGALITHVKLATNNVLWAGVQMRIHFYASALTTPPVDNAAMGMNYANNQYIGSIDVTFDTAATLAGTDAVRALNITDRLVVQPVDRTLYIVPQILTTKDPIALQKLRVCIGVIQGG